MVLWATILILQGAGFVGSMPGIPGVPENVRVNPVNSTSVRVSWNMSQVDQIERYDVVCKPTDASYRVVTKVAGNSKAVTLGGLNADTQYQLVLITVRAGKRIRSRPIVFQISERPAPYPQQDAAGAVTEGLTPPPPPSAQQPQTYIQIRGVEIGIVVLVLIVWAGAIALFFNRWGKIRMLLPYQPDYKEQLKVPGTGVCAAATTNCTQHSTQHACSQHLHWSNHHVDSLDSGGGLGWPRPTRPRVNSAIDVAGFLSQEFVRRHGSTSRLCRKVRSADNLPLATSSSRRDQDQRRGERGEGGRGGGGGGGGERGRGDLRNLGDEIGEDDRLDDREIFLNSSSSRDNQQEFSRDTIRDSHRFVRSDESEPMTFSFSSTFNAANHPQDNNICSNKEAELLPHQESASSSSCVQQHFRDSGVATPSLVPRRIIGWRVGGSHEYVRCPVRQPGSIDDKFYRRSCEPDFARLSRHHGVHQPAGHHHLQHGDHLHSRSCDYARRTGETSGDTTQHFGLPILSISEPSPPDETDRVDEYL